MEKEQPFNTMCLDCRYLGGLCSGTQAKFYSGCVWKSADPSAVKKFSESMDKTIREAEK